MGGWINRLVVCFRISAAEFNSNILSVFLLFRILCISSTRKYSGNRISAHVLQAPCATFELNHVQISAKSFLAGSMWNFKAVSTVLITYVILIFLKSQTFYDR